MTLILDACCFPYITYTMCGLWIRPLLMFECLCCPSHFPVADSAFISIPVFALPRIIVVYVFPLVTSAIIFQSRRGTICLPLSPCFPILLTLPPTLFPPTERLLLFLRPTSRPVPWCPFILPLTAVSAGGHFKDFVPISRWLAMIAHAYKVGIFREFYILTIPIQRWAP